MDTGVVERFWEKVDVGMPDDCWEWKAATDGPGYGRFSINGRLEGAHRVSWEMANDRKIPEGMQINHVCDNRPCVNPSHLHLGTQRSNICEAYKRDRGVGRRKLTKGDVKAMRELYCTGAFSYNDLVDMFGVTKPNVGYIIRRETWKHVYQSEETDA